MTLNIYNEIYEQVKDEGIIFEEFQQVITHLLEYGVICREDSQKEERFYDLYVRVEGLIVDYLSVLNINVVHDQALLSVRLYAPGSDYPNRYDDEEIPSRMSMNLSTQESAFLIALAILYDLKISQGLVGEDGSIEVDLEEFNTALATYLSYTPSETKTSREEALRTLKRLKVIEFAKGVFEDEDKPLIVRPHIKQIILPEMLRPFVEKEENKANNSEEELENED